jgi:(2Fe-2S) ferredoxin
MSKYKHKHVDSVFNLEGRFLGFAAEEGSYKLKFLRLSTVDGEYRIKLSKDLRVALYRSLTPGEWVQVTGCQTLKPEKGIAKLKAYQVSSVLPRSGQPGPSGQFAQTSLNSASNRVESSSPVGAASAKPTILICQKSDCCKRGGRAVANALQAELSDRGLTDQVTVKPTGCMKRCKAGPNVVMPDKTRYSHIRPDTVPELLDKHFPSPIEA